MELYRDERLSKLPNPRIFTDLTKKKSNLLCMHTNILYIWICYACITLQKSLTLSINKDKIWKPQQKKDRFEEENSSSKNHKQQTSSSEKSFLKSKK